MKTTDITKAAITLSDIGSMIATGGAAGGVLGAGSGAIKHKDSDGVARNTGRGAVTGVGAGIGAGLGLGAADLGLGLLGADTANPTLPANVIRAVLGLYGGVQGARLGRQAGQSMLPEYQRRTRRRV